MFFMHSNDICYMVELSKEEIQNIYQDTQRKIGEKIREIREGRNMTQTQLAIYIQSDRQYMYKIESGKVGVSITKLAVIAKALEVKLTELVDIDI